MGYYLKLINVIVRNSTNLTASSSSCASIPSQFDIIVVGTGAAGLYAALCLPSSLQIGLVTKDSLKTGASDWAQGGIAAAIDPSDSPFLHLEDTMRAGAGLCEKEAVQFLVEQAASSIESLVEMGVAFDREGEKLAMTLEAAHSHSRVLHAADTTGRAIITTLTTKVLERSNIEILSQAFALNLWINPQNGHCQGISLLYGNQIHWIAASAVILATGGGGQVFAQTTNPAVSTGDGVAMAWRAGALLRDLEFFQFHPTALTQPGAPRFLISEAVRGEGAHLIDSQGNRFAFDYHPSGELAPRDVVSRAIFSHLQKITTNPTNDYVYLDMRPIPVQKIGQRFPNIIQVCQRWDIDVFHQPIPVAPAAHYWMGGIVADSLNQTSIPRLYAIGETASTGVHGANRLASNSLLECLVYAAQFSQLKIQLNISRQKHSECSILTEDWQEKIILMADIRKQLPKLMWQSAGICRSQVVLEKAIAQIESWKEQFMSSSLYHYLFQLSPSQTIKFDFPQAKQQLRVCAETLNLLDVGYLILKSAIFRTETRGGHYRADYPQSSPSWQGHTSVQGNYWWKSSLKD